MEITLLNCPFCNGKAVLVEIIGYPDFPWSVECEECYASLGTKYTERVLVMDAWNRRSNITADALLQKYADALRGIAEFGHKNSGLGYSCSEMAKKALL